MELKEFLSNFAEQFDDTDINEINEATEFRNLDEWSSIIAMSVIAMAKTVYGKDINGGDIRNCKTVEDLYSLIKSK